MWTAWESFATYSHLISKFSMAEKIYKVPSNTYLLGACCIACSKSIWCRTACLKGFEEAMGMSIGAERNKTRGRTRSVWENCTHPQRRTLHLAEVQKLEHYIFQFNIILSRTWESSASVFLFLKSPKHYTLKTCNRQGTFCPPSNPATWTSSEPEFETLQNSSMILQSQLCYLMSCWKEPSYSVSFTVFFFLSTH